MSAPSAKPRTSAMAGETHRVQNRSIPPAGGESDVGTRALDPASRRGGRSGPPSAADLARAALGDDAANDAAALHDLAADFNRYERSLGPLLRALGWGGQARHLIDALPHFDRVATVEQFRLVLLRLGFRSDVRQGRAGELSDTDFPCLLLTEDDALVAIRRAGPGKLSTVDAAGRETIVDAPRRVLRILRAYEPEHDPEGARVDPKAFGWFWVAARRLRRDFRAMMLLTLAINTLALTAPLFSMAVYNNVIRSGVTETLFAAAVIALGAVLLDAYLRNLRGRTLAETGARLNNHVQRDSFEKILTLPAHMTESASVSMQTARLRQFEAILGVFASPVAVAVMDLPFTLLFIIVIALIGGPLAWIPIIVILIFAAAALLWAPAAWRLNAEVAQSRLQAQDFVRLTIRGAETIRGLGVEQAWFDKLRPMLAGGGKARLKMQLQEALLRGAAQMLTGLTVVAVLGLGALLVMREEMSLGALIAVMMVIWRVLTPAQTIFLSLNQLASVRDAVRQLDGLMRLAPERRLDEPPTIYRRFEGRLRCVGLSFRYPRAPDAVLRGLNLSVDPGAFVGVLGESGAGKTTLIKLLLKLHHPSAGQIFLDQLNLAQLDPGEVRAAIGYAPEKAQILFGTIAQNLRFAHRTATEAAMARELRTLGFDLGGPLYPDGLETRLTAARAAAISDAELQRISLARALVTNAPLLLLDDPTTHLDAATIAALGKRLRDENGVRSVLAVSNDPRLLRQCDRIAVLAEGRIIRSGAPEDVLPTVKGMLSV